MWHKLCYARGSVPAIGFHYVYGKPKNPANMELLQEYADFLYLPQVLDKNKEGASAFAFIPAQDQDGLYVFRCLNVKRCGRDSMLLQGCASQDSSLCLFKQIPSVIQWLRTQPELSFDEANYIEAEENLRIPDIPMNTGDYTGCAARLVEDIAAADEIFPFALGVALTKFPSSFRIYGETAPPPLVSKLPQRFERLLDEPGWQEDDLIAAFEALLRKVFSRNIDVKGENHDEIISFKRTP